MSIHARRRSAVLATLVAVVVGLVLPGCSTAQPGQAAVVGETRIPESRLADQLRAVNEATGRPADEPDATAVIQILNYDIAFELIRQTAARLEVTVPQAQLDQAYQQQVQSFGGEEQLVRAAAQEGLAPDQLRDNFSAQLVASAIVNLVAPGADQQEQGVVFQRLIGEVAAEVGVDVAPKYGTWDPATLQLVTRPDPVSRPQDAPTASPQAP